MSTPHVVVMWESFGPTHHDRLRALARAGFAVDAIELTSKSSVYQWERSEAEGYRIHTLRSGRSGGGRLRVAWNLVRKTLQCGAREVLFCHYERLDVFLAAIALRIMGRPTASIGFSCSTSITPTVGRGAGC